MADIIYAAKSAYKDLLDSIRAKAGVAGLLTLGQAKDAVDSIQTGGGADTLTQLIEDSLTSYSNSDATALNQYLFYNCTNLRTASFPNVASFSDHLFAGCTSLREITIGKGTSYQNTGVNSDAMHNCPALERINGLGYLMAVGQYGFSGCQNLDQEIGFVTSHSTSNNIGLRAFEGCSKITIKDNIVFANGTIGGLAFYGCTSIGPKLKIKANSLGTGTGTNASGSFEGCTGLEAVWLQKNGTYGQSTIKVYAGTQASGRCPFWGCTNLKVICTNATAKPSDWGTYYNSIDSSTAVTVKFGISEEDFDAATIEELIA